MKTLLTLLASLALAAGVMAKPLSDLISPDKRKQSVDLGNQLSHPADPAALPADLVYPFAPPGFEQIDPEERTAAQAGARTQQLKREAEAQKAAADRAQLAPTDHELLDAITSKIAPSGTIMLGDSRLLVFGKQFVRAGAHFTVSYKDLDYDLELTAITATTFTLRLNREEITRPILKSGKSQ